MVFLMEKSYFYSKTKLNGLREEIKRVVRFAEAKISFDAKCTHTKKTSRFERKRERKQLRINWIE